MLGNFMYSSVISCYQSKHMITDIKPRPCLSCNKPVKGRSDKKFCDDYCRNKFNNLRRLETNSLIRKINRILQRNRSILESALPSGEKMRRTSRLNLADKGFRFNHFTHKNKNKKGQVYHYCYDYGWLDLDRENCIVVKNRDQSATETPPPPVD